MQVPSGRSGVHAVPKTPHSQGLIWPVSTSPQRHALGSSMRARRKRVETLGIPGGESRPDAERAAGQRAEPAPLEVRPQLHRLLDRGECPGVALGPDHPRVLVLDLAAALGALAQQHGHCLQQVDRLECRHNDRSPVLLGDEAIGVRADHGGDVAGADECVDTQPRRLEDRAQGRLDRDVVAEDGEVRRLLCAGAKQRHRGGGSGRLEADREEDHAAVGQPGGERERVERGVHHAHVGAARLGLEQ